MPRRPHFPASQRAVDAFVRCLAVTGCLSAASVAWIGADPQSDETWRRRYNQDPDFRLRFAAAEVCAAARLACDHRPWPTWDNASRARRHSNRITALARAIRKAALADGLGRMSPRPVAPAASIPDKETR